MTKVIIIGGVAGGSKTAAKLKRLKPEYEITIYTKEPKMTNFKKLLRLNRLVPFEELSREHRKILIDSNLTDEYSKLEFWTLPEKWAIKNSENHPEIVTWFNRPGNSAMPPYISKNGIWMHYPAFKKFGNFATSSLIKKEDYIEITLEQFKKYVLCKQT